MLDSKLTFTTHMKAVSESVTNSAKAIERLMPNICGLSLAKRSLLTTVVTSRLLYAAPIWVKRATKFEIHCETINRVLRLAAVRVARCNRMVSTAAALVLAGIPRAIYWPSRRNRCAE